MYIYLYSADTYLQTGAALYCPPQSNYINALNEIKLGGLVTGKKYDMMKLAAAGIC